MASSTLPQQRVAMLALAVLSPSFSHLSLPGSSHSLSFSRLSLPAGEASEPRGAAAALQLALARRACTYTVQMRTSCSSPRCRNEVYAARVTPRYGFERFATDTFEVAGPCGYGTPSTFYYGDPLPDGVWFGFDRCVAAGAGAGASSEPGAAAQAL